MNGNIVIRNQEELRAFALDKNTVSIGSGPAAGLMIDAPGIEPVHALITWEPRASTWLLSAASPGTECTLLLNGRACPTDATLEDGDLINFPGGIIMRFSAAPSLPSFGGKESREIPLRGISKLIIGRVSGDAWSDPGKVLLDPEDARISRIHLELEQTAPGVFYATDKSTTGTLLNGRRFDRRLLIAGDRLRLGGYSFEFSGNALHLIPGHGGARVEARNVSMQSRDGRYILNDISLEISPGSLVGIFSGTNQDRNTLMNALDGAKQITGGEVRINGALMGDPRAMARAGIGRVPQDDIVHRELTVTEAITCSARLNLPGGTPRTSILQLVEETIGQLGLSELKHQRIGSLSGSDRKRVSIAVELLARPDILFLDEPLSGLDPDSESDMMSLLRQLTGADCTVVCATHVPERAYLFDQICCLQDGRLIFNGTPDEAKSRFGIEQDLNEIFLKAGANQGREFGHSCAGANPPASFTPAEDADTTLRPQKRGTGHLAQLGILLRRQWHIFKPSPRHLLLFLAHPLIIGLLIGWMLEQAALQILLCVIATFWFGCSNGARQIVREIAVLRSERAHSLGMNSYLLSKYILLAFITTLQAILLVFTIHATSIITNSSKLFGTGLWPAVLAGAALAGVATGLTISASVRTATLAVVCKLLVLALLFAFGGFAFSHPDMLASLPAPVSLTVLGGCIVVCYGSTLLALNGKLRKDNFTTPMTSPARPLLRFMARYPWRIALGLAMAVAGTLLGFVFPGVTQWFLDDIIPNKKLGQIMPAVLLAWGAFFLRQIFYSLRTLANNSFELRMTYDLRSQLHDRIQHLPLKWFDRQSTGDILTRMSDDVPATQRVILDGVDQGAPAVLQVLLTAGVMFFLHWKLALVVMLPMPLIAAGGWIYARWVSPRAREAREAASGLNTLLHDNIAGIRQIKSYTLEEQTQQDFNTSSGHYRERQTKLQRAWAVYAPGMGLMGDTGVVLLMGFGAWWAIQGEISIGQLGQFLLLIGMLYEPIGRLHGINQTFVTGLACARRIFDILELDGAEDLKRGDMLQDVHGEIRFNDVSFRYDGSRPTVSGLNITVLPQQTVAFVGATGAGKSTLFQLLTRFYECESGTITLDGKSIRDLNKAGLRDAIGYVTQESYLFNQTIRENLRLGKPDATDGELWRALEQACAKEFVERMEGGLDATVGERGSRLSGGEKQRISIARAFLKNAPILLLDEATSAVDNKSERLIQQAIDQLRANRTCLVIAHRLSTVRHADRIYVMREGRVLAHGTHAELMESCEYYAELVKLSFQEEKLQG